MPLGASGALLGAALAASVGAPPSAGASFGALGAAIASWVPAHVTILPGAMAAASGVVAGLGTLSVTGAAAALGAVLADALAVPADATSVRSHWAIVAAALISHVESFGVANGTGFTSGTPLGGAGTLQWTSPTMVPSLATQLGVSNAVAAATIQMFERQVLATIAAVSTVASASLSGAPLSAPANGPVVGTGTIA